MGLDIRRACIEDLAIIADFNAAMARETEGIDLDQAGLFNGVKKLFDTESDGFYLVAEIDGRVQACLMITYEWSDWRNGRFWWIQSVYVHKEFRKQGLFKKMYTHVKTMVDSDDTIVGLRLYVEKENQVARNVYENIGMIETPYRLYEYSKKPI